MNLVSFGMFICLWTLNIKEVNYNDNESIVCAFRSRFAVPGNELIG